MARGRGSRAARASLAAWALLTIVAAAPAAGDEPGAAAETSAAAATTETIEVTAPRYSAVPGAETATKMDVPVRDIPQSIEVRNRQLLDDLGGSHNVYEVGETVAGVYDPGHGNGSPGINVPTFNLRGYGSTYLRDGAQRTSGWLYTMDMASIERVEFLKGPASVLYGSTGNSGNYGGLVNYVSKRPMAEPLLETEATLGSFDYYRASLDVDRAFLGDRALKLRLDGAFTDAGSFVDEAHTRSWLVAPAATAELTADDTLTLLTEFVESRATPVTGLPLESDAYDVPYGRNVIDPEFAHIDIDSFTALLSYEHRFDRDWKLVADTSVGFSTATDLENGLYLDEGGSETWHLTGSRWDFENVALSVDPRLEGRFETGPVGHTVLLGVHWQLNEYDTTATFGPDLDLGSDALPTLLPPARGAYLAEWRAASNPTGYYALNGDFVAPYLQDLVSLGEHVKVLAGVRYELIEQWGRVTGLFASGDPQFDRPDQHFDHVSPRAGLVWQPLAETSVYASYSQGYVPNVGLTRDHARLDPEEGELLEVGVKEEIGSRLDANLALYQITQDNVTDADPDNGPSENYLILLGKTRSHGIELDVNGEITDALRVTVAGALMKAWIVDGNSSWPSGNELGNAPRFTGNVFGVYSFGGAVEGLELGAGAYYASSVFADSTNTFQLPATFTLDAMAGYRFDPTWRIQLDLKNATDRRNYSATWGGTLARNDPLAVYGSVKASF